MQETSKLQSILSQINSCTSRPSSNSEVERLNCVKQIKNELIGSKSRKAKLLQLGLLERISAILTIEHNPDIVSECLVVLSLLHTGGKKEFSSFWDAAYVQLKPQLMNLFYSGFSNEKLQKQWANTFKCILTECTPWGNVAMNDFCKIQECFYKFYKQKDLSAVVDFASIIFHIISYQFYVNNEVEESKFINSSLIDCIKSTCIQFNEEIPEEILELLYLLVKNVKLETILVFYDESFFASLLLCIKNVFGKCSKQILACSCFILMERKCTSLSLRKIVSISAIPCLLSILSGDISYGEIKVSDRAKAAITIAFAISEDEKFQQIAEENCGIAKLCQALIDVKEGINELEVMCIENALIALSCISSNREEVRSIIFSNQKLIKLVVEFLQHSAVPIRNAACLCIRSLSRSPKGLRTCLSEYNIFPVLSSFLNDPNDSLRLSASASICNLVLEYSPMKNEAFKEDTLDKLVRLCDVDTEKNIQIRANAIWALKNLLYQSSFEQKKDIFTKLGKRLLLQCFSQEELAVQIQMMNFLRNSLCGSVAEIDFVVKFIGESELFEICQNSIEKQNDLINEQLVFAIVNLMVGNESHLNFFFTPQHQSFLLQLIALFKSTVVNIRKGALWAVNNMICGNSFEFAIRMAELKKMGIEKEIFDVLSSETDPTVQDIAKKVSMKFEQ